MKLSQFAVKLFQIAVKVFQNAVIVFRFAVKLFPCEMRVNHERAHQDLQKNYVLVRVFMNCFDVLAVLG